MKKSLFIIAATALVFTACSDVDTFKKDVQTGNDGAISFTSYSQPVTRAENSSATNKWVFFNHHTTFQVWGYKNTETTAVFSDDEVTVAEDASAATGYSYTYSPLRYWDKAATTYKFYAAAPSTNGGWQFNGVTSVATQADGYFTTTSTITGANLKLETPGTSLSNTFKGQADIDKLIAEPCSVDKAKFGIEPVQLNFIHILSKLNVSIKKDATKLNTQTVKLVSFEVENLYNKGDFDESTVVANLSSGSNARWTKANDAAALTYSAKTNWEITTDVNYIIESLVIPQDAEVEVVALDGEHHNAEFYTWAEYQALTGYDAAKVPTEAAFNDLKVGTISMADYNTSHNTYITDGFDALIASVVNDATEIAAVSGSSKPYFKIVYTIQDGQNNPEQFTAYFNLATAFKGAAAQASTIGFYEGWQNTLNIIISPDEIEFTANVYEWSTKNEETLTIR